MYQLVSQNTTNCSRVEPRYLQFFWIESDNERKTFDTFDSKNNVPCLFFLDTKDRTLNIAPSRRPLPPHVEDDEDALDADAHDDADDGEDHVDALDHHPCPPWLEARALCSPLPFSSSSFKRSSDGVSISVVHPTPPHSRCN
jgi:hypothetical protein